MIGTVFFPNQFRPVICRHIFAGGILGNSCLSVNIVKVGSPFLPILFRSIQDNSATISEIFHHDLKHSISINRNSTLLFIFSPGNGFQGLPVFSIEAQKDSSRELLLQYAQRT